ncbi:MAG: hypothetical protein EFT35_01925 [Methanophagales archaeon ANME-1-THS]|nr:MAG: hypothetical protein EFT35_01925 [Methanophagales archaeon ANME-1-THS]
MKLAEVKRVYEHELLQKANVVGVMTGYKIKEGKKTDELSIISLVEKKIPKEELKKKDLIPTTIKGVTTDVIPVGKLRALQIDKKARHRPCPMGTSGGHYLITAGTNGELLRDKKSGKICIGTNNHVGANSNNAVVGDLYLQPGPYDGGTTQSDILGYLLRFVPIAFFGEPSTCPAARFWSGLYNIPAGLFGRRTRLRPVIEYPEYNLVDAAMIEVAEKDVSVGIVDIGLPKGVRQAQIEMHVQKSGRTSCHTVDGPITGIDATIGPISYGTTKFAYFKDQIVISKPGFSAGGDSGSLVLDMDGYAVGKLFAGSEEITIANHIQNYLAQLDAELVTE